MKQQYQRLRFASDTIDLIDTMNAIVDDYVAQGYRLTVRQLYYQLVARAVIPNTERSYKRTTDTVNNAKLAGLIDWDAIEDRTRSFIRRAHWHSVGDMLEQDSRVFFVDMWTNQPKRVFCIVEKEALAGVLDRVCSKFDIPLLAARGYPSGTVLREFAQTDLMRAVRAGQGIVILHLGDHDPSGIDMSRDLETRLTLFNEFDEIKFKRIALNMAQIKKERPPPNPAKTTDSRFAEYQRAYGDDSWELDALQPSFLNALVEKEAKQHIDTEAWAASQKRVDDGRARLQDLAARVAAQDETDTGFDPNGG